MYVCMYSVWMDGGWTDGWMDGWTDGWIDGWTDGRMDGHTDGWMDGCMHVRDVCMYLHKQIYVLLYYIILNQI